MGVDIAQIWFIGVKLDQDKYMKKFYEELEENVGELDLLSSCYDDSYLYLGKKIKEYEETEEPELILYSGFKELMKYYHQDFIDVEDKVREYVDSEDIKMDMFYIKHYY